MALPTVLPVSTREEMQNTMTAYVAQGYAVVAQTDTSIIMSKKKELNMVWMIVGFFICLIPMIIELIRYSRDEDLVIEIKLEHAIDRVPNPPLPPHLEGTHAIVSEDGKSYWDGTRWQPIGS